MPGDYTAPTPEQVRRGARLVEHAIADEAGRPSQPYRSIDILGALERRGAITSEMRAAGEAFQARFRSAALDPLRAGDMARVRGGLGPVLTGGASGARDAVWAALVSVGGPGSVGGSCLWHVLGWEKSLREWSLEEGWRGKRVPENAAPYVLITVLGILARERAVPR
jgi:hypothetical protein